MITVSDKVKKVQKSFWNQCVFHPTDAIEDPWGKRILDRMSGDGAIGAVRIYAMLEDIVYIDGNSRLCYDFRLSDLRLDYLIGRGYDLVIAYAGIPDCIARSTDCKSSVSKNKTRYKGKMWNTSPPVDYALWEEICYEYTKHLVERYGEKMLHGWKVHCFNEPDVSTFFLSNITDLEAPERAEEYLRLYEAFSKGVRRASSGLSIGGPALAVRNGFLRRFLTGVKERGLEIDYIAIHFYGTDPELLNSGEEWISVEFMMKRISDRLSVVRECGFSGLPLVIDEWGACSHGFFNVEECPTLIFRETEVYSAYFVRFISRIIESGLPIENLMICLSGQHEMTEDFSGFRNFFTLNFIAKPIYNAYRLFSMLGSELLDFSSDSENISVIPTKTKTGGYAVLISYAAEDFSEDIPNVRKTVNFTENIVGREVDVWCIDRKTTNPYRLAKRLGISKNPTAEEISLLRDEGRMKPQQSFVARENSVTLDMSASSVFLITVK